MKNIKEKVNKIKLTNSFRLYLKISRKNAEIIYGKRLKNKQKV